MNISINRNIENNTYFNFRVEIGLILIIIGMQLGTAIRNFTKGVDLVDFIMILSLILVIDYRNLFKLRFPRLNIFSLLLIWFQSLIVIYAIYSGRGTRQLYSYHIYIIAIILSLATQNRDKEFKSFFKILFYITGFISFVIFMQATNGGTELVTSYYGTGKLWLEFGGDPVSTSRGLVIGIISTLMYECKSISEKVLKAIFIIFSIIGLLSFSNRSSIVISIVILCVFLLSKYSKKVSIRTIIKQMILFSILILMFITIYNTSEYLNTQINGLIDSINKGFYTFLGDTSYGIDSSAATRVALRSRVFDIISNEFRFYNYLFGYGYNNFYVDMPILQIFLDMGILGFTMYFVYIIYIPLQIFIQKNTTDIGLFIKLFLVQMVMDQFYCGLPYYYFYFTPAILIITFKSSIKNKEKII